MAPLPTDFPKRRRLLSAPQFRAVFHDGTKSRDTLLAVFAKANSSEQARLGVAVSRRVSPRATVRNRIRRQIRESFRLRQGDLLGMDVVVVAQPACAEHSRRALRSALERHWQRILGRCKVP